MTARRRVRTVARVGSALVGLVLLLSACGIPMQDEPQPLPPGAVPGSIASPLPSQLLPNQP